MSRLQSVVLTVAAITIAGFSFVPPWTAVDPYSGWQETARITVPRPLGFYPLIDPPVSEDHPFVRVDYGRVALCYLGTMALVIPFFGWGRRSHDGRIPQTALGGGRRSPMISREQAREIADGYRAESGEEDWLGIKQVVEANEVGWQLPRIWGYSESILKDFWIAYVEQPGMALRSFVVILVAKDTGEVKYAGSAGDEG